MGAQASLAQPARLQQGRSRVTARLSRVTLTSSAARDPNPNPNPNPIPNPNPNPNLLLNKAANGVPALGGLAAKGKVLHP